MKFYIYATKPEFDIKVFGHQLFCEDGMLCCADPIIAIPCKIGDVFAVEDVVDMYGEHQFDINAVQLPTRLNSFVAWLCGFNADRRCPAWRWKFNRSSFKSHTQHPTELRTLDERVIPDKLYMAVVRSADATVYPTRLWAGIDSEPLTVEEILSVADLIVPRVRTDWTCIKLKEYGIDIDPTTLRKARGHQRFLYANHKDGDKQ